MDFDFVREEDLRASLESDYKELTSAMEVGAWKAVHVLAGSIIEALLVDHLVITNYQGRHGRDPLTMELAPLISTCKTEGILTERTEQLSTVVRGYRNLIHPGRVVRLNEKVSQSTAKIAAGLVDLIIEEVAAKRREVYGYTAEQVVAKIEHDHSALAILNHFLREMNSYELERFLVKVLPQRYFEYLALPDDLPVGPTVAVLWQSFRPAFDLASDDIKAKVAKKFVTILREETETNVLYYENYFFRAKDLAFLTPDEATLVKEHLLARFQHGRGTNIDSFLIMAEGIGPYLSPSEATSFAQAVCAIASRDSLDLLHRQSLDLTINIGGERLQMSHDAQVAFDERLDEWIQSWRLNRQEEKAAIFEDMRRSWAGEISEE